MNANEYEYRLNGYRVYVSKDGGGTLGKRYEGDWTVTVMNGPVHVLDNDVITTGTPKTHREVAYLATELAWESEGE